MKFKLSEKKEKLETLENAYKFFGNKKLAIKSKFI